MPIDPNRLPSWSEFLFAARRQGIAIAERDVRLTGPKGTPGFVRYLQRGSGPKIIVPPLGIGEIVQEPLFSHLCRRLEIDPTPLGILPEELNPGDAI